jgi:U4/U6.U5 tri-snRNP component SNU23
LIGASQSSHRPLLADLRRLGQTTQAARSTLDQVREKIASLRAATAQASASKAYDFDARLREVARVEEARRAEEKQRRVAKRAEKREEREQARKGEQVGGELAEMMGFGGFGSSKK